MILAEFMTTLMEINVWMFAAYTTHAQARVSRWNLSIRFELLWLYVMILVEHSVSNSLIYVEYIKAWFDNSGVWGSIYGALVMCRIPWASFESTLNPGHVPSTYGYREHESKFDSTCWMCRVRGWGFKESNEYTHAWISDCYNL